ncbi:MAG: amino acid adenylation domain-containing protein [Crocosphaera sp.]
MMNNNFSNSVINTEITEEVFEEDIFVFPTSFTQERLWLLEKLRGDRSIYTFSGGLELLGPLQIPALEEALKEIVHRHEILRTTFPVVDDSPVQAIAPTLNIPLTFIDLQGLGKETQSEQVKQLMGKEEKRSLDIAKDSLLRVILVCLAPEHHVLIVTMHHIISDGWSIGVFIEELSLLYHAFSRGLTSPLAELPIQYADFAEWQRQWFTGEVLETQLSYWKQQLTNAPSMIDLPVDRPRPAMQSFRGSHQSVILNPSLVSSLNELSLHQGVTLFITLLTALKILLFKWTEQKDLIVGTVIAGRNQADLEPLIGCFMNFLALRSQLSETESVEELLKKVKLTVLDAYSHQDCPFEKVVEAINPNRETSHNPIYNVALLLQNYPSKPFFSDNLDVNPLFFDSETAFLDLRFVAYESSEKIVIDCEYNTDIFEPETINRMLGHFQTLLERIVTNPQEKIADLSLLSEAQRHQLLVEWNETQRDYPQDKCLHQLIEEQVKKTPEAVAVIFDAQQLTYRELNARANQLAQYLQSLKVAPDQLVGIAVERSLLMIIGLLGILKAGGAYVPIDPTYPKQRLDFMLLDSQVNVLLTQEKFASQFPDMGAEIVCLDRDWETVAQQSQENPVSQVEPHNLAYVIYTSGSTGTPKGAMNSHQGIVNRLLWMQETYQLTSEDRVLQKTPFSFDVSVWEFFWPLLTGARLVVAQPEGHRDSRYLVNLIAEQKITTLHFVPSMLQVFLQEPDLDRCSNLKRVVCSGEALPVDLQQRFFNRLECELHNLYGPTEAAIDVTYWECQSTEEQRTVPIGRPVANTQLYILDKAMQPVPIGVKGELHIGGIQLAKGYLNRPELTAEKFIPNPFSKNSTAKLYKTGDLARYLSDGNIEYLGRIDHQVKIRGFRIELGEIEAVLAKQPSVRETVVVPKTGQSGDQRLIAYIVPNHQQPMTTDESSVSSLDDERIAQWQQVFNETYSQTTSVENATFNISGWNDSYSGLPIPAEQMAEWVDSTVERILTRQPQRVLEIGCGTGMLLFRIAPSCQSYWGTDISQQAIDYVKEQMRNMGGDWQQIKLAEKPAHDFQGFEPDSCDGVILNSVVQLFPSIDYLAGVLEQAIDVVAPGGFIFIGDVRNLELLETFHTSVQCYKALDSLCCTALRERIQQSVAQEEELAISPDFFTALKTNFPKISHVQIELKRGHHHNELTRFRYDVILHIGKPVAPTVHREALDWQENQLTVAEIGDRLRETQPECLLIKNVPNARLKKVVNLEQFLDNSEGTATVKTLRELLEPISKEQAIEPEEFWSLSQDLPYAISVTWSNSGDNADYDVWCQRRSEKDGLESPLNNSPVIGQVQPWSTYANNPLQGQLAHQLVPQLRDFLQEQLPDYMIPNGFVLLESMPLTPNGKVDRRALPEPEMGLRSLREHFVAPRTDTEKTLAAIWSEVLGVEPIGIHDNFFDLGGYSLIAVGLMAQIQQKLGTQLPLATLFQSPTIEQLATILEEDESSLPWSSLVPIQPHGSKPPLFCIPGVGGNVIYFQSLAQYLGSDQPFYGLQSLGLDGISQPHTCVEEMAAHYIQVIRSVQPEGPYRLGGHSFGGRVAFEMAQQLQKQGEVVEILAIFDVPAPYAEEEPMGRDWHEARWSLEIAKVIQRLSQTEVNVSQETFEKLTSGEQLSYLTELLQKVNLLPPGADSLQVKGFCEVFKANYQMYYLPPTSQKLRDTRILLFQAEEINPEFAELRSKAPQIFQDPTWGWQQVCQQPVVVDQVPGAHITMMANPFVKSLADRLKVYL